MKKKYYIVICTIIYVVLLIAIFQAVDNHINDKYLKLRNEAIENLNSFFLYKPMYVDLLYGPYNCDYIEIPVPSPKVPDFFDIIQYQEVIDSTLTYTEVEELLKQKYRKNWEKNYGDFRAMFELDIVPQFKRSGWALKLIEKMSKSDKSEGIYIFLLFPKQVAYKHIEPILYGSVPSIETAIEQALEFTIYNEKSNLQPYYERGSTYNLIYKMEAAINNEYFHFTEDPEGTHFIYNPSDLSKPSSIEYGGMENGYYKVITHITQPKTYSIKFIGNTKHDKLYLKATYLSLLTIIMAGIIIYIVKKK